MRRAWLVLLGVMILSVCAAPAFAGTVNEIVLGSSSGAPVSFTGTGGGGFFITFNVKNLVANGTGTLASSGFYSIVNNGANVRNGGSCGTGCFLLTQGSPVSFAYSSTFNGLPDLLTGDLWFSSLTQTAGGGGIFNDALVINFVATGGSLQDAFNNGNGIVQLTIKFTTKDNLASIINNQVLMAKVVSGAMFAVPEPASLALLGASLLGLAGLAKRKKLFA